MKTEQINNSQKRRDEEKKQKESAIEKDRHAYVCMCGEERGITNDQAKNEKLMI